LEGKLELRRKISRQFQAFPATQDTSALPGAQQGLHQTLRHPLPFERSPLAESFRPKKAEPIDLPGWPAHWGKAMECWRETLRSSRQSHCYCQLCQWERRSVRDRAQTAAKI